MKNFIFLLIFLLCNNVLKSQWFCEGVYTLNFEDTFCLNLSIDSLSNPNNIWQTGMPQKSIFDSAYSYPKVIVTDTINPYPPNDTSIFTIKHIADWGFTFPHTAVLSGYYQVNSDSLKDFGLIEFSPDNGNTWIDLLTDTVYNSDYYWSTPIPILTGSSNGWKQFYVWLEGLGPIFNIQYRDTVLYKFTFISDSMVESLDGLMFDDLHFEDWAEGVAELNFKLISSFAYPNPATERLTIEFENSESAYFDLSIYDNFGKILLEKPKLNQNQIEIQLKDFHSGMYYYRLVNAKDKKKAFGKFIVEK